MAVQKPLENLPLPQSHPAVVQSTSQERDGDERSCSSEEEEVSALQEVVNAKTRFGRIRAGIDSSLTRTRTWPGMDGQTGCLEAPFPRCAFLELSA